MGKCRKSLIVLLGLLLTYLTQSAQASPTGGKIDIGDVVIEHLPATTTVYQSSDKAIINWRTFNVAANETVSFRQPSTSSVTLNRVQSNSEPSKIFGQINANGQLILVNQAGIYFGSGAKVNVGGIIASTADISDSNFMSGYFRFDRPSSFGSSVINKGTIIVAQNGLAALIGNNVSNEGVIEAKLGSIALASGSAFTVDLSGTQLMNFVTIDAPATKNGVHPIDGSSIKDAVNNSGTLDAQGGTILLTAKSAARILDNVINMEGIATANSVSTRNGTIILLAEDEGTVRVSGKLVASGIQPNEAGGTVKILGSIVALTDDALINVTGDVGGGQVYIGGNAYGLGPELNANYTSVGSNVKILANALNKGNGGKVIVWSEQGTGFYGYIEAKGGLLEGDGGFVETSGKAYLDADGNVDASAEQGDPGQWLLDPYNVTITNKTNKGAFDNGNPNTFTPTGNSATADAATINTSLNNGTNVTITTGSSGTQAGTLTVSSPIQKTSGSSATLTLNAASSVSINSSISSSSGGLGIIINGDSLSLSAGTVITTNGGNFVSTTQNAVTLQSNSSINAGSGTITINANQDGSGSQGVTLNSNSSLLTTNTSASAIAINVNTALGGTGTVSQGGNLTTGNGGTITIATNVGGNTTGGSITMPAGGSLNVGSGTINLSTAEVSGRGVGTLALPLQIIASHLNVTTGSGGVYITNTGTTPLILGNMNTSGSLNLISTGSAGITSNGALTIPGTMTIAAGAAQDINLNNSGNNFNTVTITSARNVTLADSNTLILGASTISGTLNVTAGGHITQSGILSVTGTPTFTVSSALSDILLSSYANDFSSTPVFSNNGNIRDLSLRNVSATAAVPAIPSGIRNLTLIFNSSAMNIPATSLTGNLSLTVDGAITQSGALNVAGTTTVVAGSTNNITFNNSDNDFNTISITSGNNVLLNDKNAIVLGTSTISGTLGVTAVGAITQTGSGLTVTGETTLASGSNITLSSSLNNFSSIGVSTGNNVSLRDGNSLVVNTSSILGTLTITTAGSLTQNGPLTVSGLTTLSVGSGNDITFDNSANHFSSVRVTTARNVTLKASNSVILGASTVSGDYNITAGGTISQNGTLTITGTPTFTLSAPNSDILLSTSANVFNTTPVITNNGNVRDVLLRNTTVNAQAPLLPSNLRNLTLTFNNAALTLPAVTLTGIFIGQSSGGMIFSGNFTMGAASTIIVNAGTLTVANSATLTTNNNNLTITATDLDLASSGAINVGSGTLRITQNIASGSIGLGSTTGTMTISGSELGRIIANIFYLTAPLDGKVIVDGITAANSIGVATMNLVATNGQASIETQNHSSSFRSLTVSANDGIIIGNGAALNATEGNLSLNGDAGGVGGIVNAIILNDNLVSEGTLSLSAVGNGIILNSPVTLNGNGITISHKVNGAQALTLNSGSGTVNFQAAVGDVTPLTSLAITSGSNTVVSRDIHTTGNIDITASGDLTLSTGSLTSNSGSVLLAGLGITLNSPVYANASGYSIIIHGGSFTNNYGIGALNTGLGHFQVWSTNPASDNRGGLSYDFKQYNATYGMAPALGQGNGFFYSVAPVITPGLVGEVIKTYNGDNAAILSADNYSFTGVLDSDSVVLNNPVNGTYSSVNVGNNINVTVSNIAIDSAMNGNATVYGYQLITTASGNIGVILPVNAANLPDESTIAWATTRFNQNNVSVPTINQPEIVILGNNTGTSTNITVGNNGSAIGAFRHAATNSISHPVSAAGQDLVFKPQDTLLTKTSINNQLPIIKMIWLALKSHSNKQILGPILTKMPVDQPTFVLLTSNFVLLHLAWLGMLILLLRPLFTRQVVYQKPLEDYPSSYALFASYQVQGVLENIDGLADILYADNVNFVSGKYKSFLASIMQDSITELGSNAPASMVMHELLKNIIAATTTIGNYEYQFTPQQKAYLDFVISSFYEDLEVVTEE